jgi:hypothetical protein
LGDLGRPGEQSDVNVPEHRGMPRTSWVRLAVSMLLGVVPIVVLVVGAIEAVRLNSVGVDFRGELYPEAKLLLHGHDPFPASDADLSGGVNRIFPIPAAALVGPLTLLPVAAATVVFTVLLLAAFGGTLWLLGVRDWRVYGAVALWPATLSALQTANLTILLALLVAVAWRWRDRRWTPGIAVGAAIALKLFLWPLVVWLIAFRRYASAAVATALAVAGTLLVVPFVSLPEYARLMRNLGSTFSTESYNVVGLCAQVGLGTGAVADTVAAAIGLGLIAVAYRHRSLPLALAASLVLSPIVWLHYFVLLAIPLATTRPAFAGAWLVPLALWLVPGSGNDVRAWHVAVALVVLGVTTLLTAGSRHSFLGRLRIAAVGDGQDRLISE